jgi:CubicO group peptidase (beta-lactamase class C family)
MAEYGDVDAIVADYQAKGGQPGLVYGIVRDGELTHTGGLGQRSLGGPPPDAGTVFRIASMSKSFTAAAILLLRDSGELALDEPAARYVPELGEWAVAPTVRQLLTMTAGLAEEDPWADRQQELPLDEFGAFLAGGVTFSRMPGIRFEYSNLGYAILGRVVSNVSGVPFKDFVRSRLMLPLGMTQSGYEPPAEGLAPGYRRGPSGWEELETMRYGAFAPMGGVFTTITDLARWVAGFMSEDDAHPLRLTSRREMQLPQVPTLWDRPAVFPADGYVTSYGFGLSMGDDPVIGRLAGHGGGYPGYGSYMRWHADSGTGVIAFANSTYARMNLLTARLLAAIVRKPVPEAPWPATVAARPAVNALLASWDDAAADRLFTANMAQDAPYPERRAALGRVRDRIGDFADDPSYPPEHDTPARSRWRLTGEHGTVQVQITLTPEREPRVMSVVLAVPPAAGSPLAKALDSVVAWMNGGADPCPVADGVTARRLKAAAAWAGRCRIAAWTAGDGEVTATAELAGEYASTRLTVTIDPGTGHIGSVSVTM